MNINKFDLTGVTEPKATSMKKRDIRSNILSADTLRGIQTEVLEHLSSVLKQSFGPMGSNTGIKRENALTQYSKDGHTILSNIHYNGVVEESIKDDIETITRYIVKTVGDGTTSAVILCDLIFKGLLNHIDNGYTPNEILKELNAVVSDIKHNLKANAVPCTMDDIYDICMISTNDNEETSKMIADIYKEYGLGVYIDVSPSTGADTYLKEYDGMTLNTGYADSCYVTDAISNTAVVDHPKIYFFEHPVDTKEMSVLFDSIIYNNILQPLYSNKTDEIVPTVIVAPRISQDVSSTMETLTNVLGKFPANNRPPILVIAGTHQVDELIDIAKLSGAKLIHKYIDNAIYQKDLAAGNAPTVESVLDWAGEADQVISDSAHTKFINPAGIHEPGSTEYSQNYKSLLSYLDTELKRARDEGEDINVIGTIKRRLNSLKRNMVEIFVGGITMADRDTVRDLVEDAVLNCRAAVETGACSAANVTTYHTMFNMFNADNLFVIHCAEASLREHICEVLFDAYAELVDTLYKTVMSSSGHSTDTSKTTGIAYNLRTLELDEHVKSSIKGEMIILDTVCKIIGIMVTCNQFTVPSPLHNVYVD